MTPDMADLHGVTGVSDWDFLCPPGMESSPDEGPSKRPSLEEFDRELAVFQVGRIVLTHCIYSTYVHCFV